MIFYMCVHFQNDTDLICLSGFASNLLHFTFAILFAKLYLYLPYYTVFLLDLDPVISCGSDPVNVEPDSQHYIFQGCIIIPPPPDRDKITSVWSKVYKSF